MAISPRQQPKNRRFQLRATVRDERLIKVAAERNGVDVSDFILSAARDRAEQALADQTRFVLDPQRWNQFMQALDRPAKDKPRLRKLFHEPHVAKRRP